LFVKACLELPDMALERRQTITALGVDKNVMTEVTDQ
jgi:hypothetical protein